jgi:hypothetical protein
VRRDRKHSVAAWLPQQIENSVREIQRLWRIAASGSSDSAESERSLCSQQSLDGHHRGDISSISSCFVQGYSDFADSNCMQCSAPCCDSVVASCAPRFDDCFAPKVLRGDGTTAFSTVNATALACMGCSAACVIRRDIWFEWSATCAGTATISVCDRDNVALVVYENGICPSPYAANGNDSDCTVWPVCASGRGAVTQATVVAGQKLLIRVGSLVANAGFDGSIQVDCAGAPAAIQCLHEQTSTTSTSTSITSTSTTTPQQQQQRQQQQQQQQLLTPQQHRCQQRQPMECRRSLHLRQIQRQRTISLPSTRIPALQSFHAYQRPQGHRHPQAPVQHRHPQAPVRPVHRWRTTTSVNHTPTMAALSHPPFSTALLAESSRSWPCSASHSSLLQC